MSTVTARSYDVAVTTTTDYLDTEAVATVVGVTPKTVRDYVYRGTFPKPDSHVGRTPVWRRETVNRWRAASTRRGACGVRHWFAYPGEVGTSSPTCTRHGCDAPNPQYDRDSDPRAGLS